MVLNAMNARYKSLYEAVKGSNLFADSKSAEGCKRYVHQELDSFIHFKTEKGKVVSFNDIVGFGIEDKDDFELYALTRGGERARLSSAVEYIGFTSNRGNKAGTESIHGFLLEHRKLKIELVVDSKTSLGPVSSKTNATFHPLVDIQLESV
eukprot:TRINITY_DN4741_c0_g1_i1.p1 TRINITY_DN4741_c0_g1~~TRINITY_DN4741_c0_g1_i1.p1  ORF type:complete len:151 (-),score=44.62 TRINITY_DN4741_c0_g1_i1:261-713(-)